MAKKKKKTSKLKKQIKDAFLLTLIICAIIFSIYIIISLAVRPTDTFILEEDIISEKESTVGYVIKEETIIDGQNEENNIEQIKSEGEKVATGTAIFKYYNSDEKEIKKQIEELNTQLQEALAGKTDLFTSDIKSIESQIEKKIENITYKNNIQEIREYKNDISNYVTKKAKIAGSLSAAGEYINNLVIQRNNLEIELSNSATYVNTPKGGIVSYRIDGLEDKLTIEKLDTLTIDELEKLNLKTGQIVSTVNNKAKIINNFEAYVIVELNSEVAKKAEEGKKVKLLLGTQEKVNATIQKVETKNNKTTIIFKINDGIENLASYRKISLDVIWWEYSGWKLPQNSIIYENGLSYVKRKRSGNTEKILVHIIKKNDNYCIVENYKTEKLKELGFTPDEINSMKTLKLYDEIVYNPEIQ